MSLAHVVALATCMIATTLASPAPTPYARPNAVIYAAPPRISPSATLSEPTKTLQKRADILSKLQGEVNSVLSAIGSVPAYVASGVPNFFQDFPSKSSVVSQLGLSDDQLNALPTQVLNLPPYANWTDQGWNVRFHGNVYLQPNTSTDKLNQLANIFVPGDLSQMSPDAQAMARNLTAEIFVVQQADKTVVMNLVPAQVGGNISNTIPASGGQQSVTLPYPTTDQGDFDAFVPINGSGLTSGNSTDRVQTINVYANGTTLGNATAYLVPDQGFTIISDIDDILRITKIYQPKQGLLNSFTKPYVPWMNMPDIYANWSKSIPNLHFHYLTTTPEQVTRNYMDFIYKTYPLGSFDTRPLNFSDVSATLAIRKYLLIKIFETFPRRKMILVADTSNSDVMTDYPLMAHMFPDNFQCILLRNTSATDNDLFPYNTKGFQGLDSRKYMFFRTPDDLVNIDLTGFCNNASVPQNVTFGYQDELLGIHGAGSALKISWIGSMIVALLTTLFVMV